MKHRVTVTKPGVVKIDIEADPPEKPKLLNSLQACQTGQCGCPSSEYAKLESIGLDVDDTGVHVQLTARHGMDIDTESVEKCLTWTKDQVEGDDG